MRRRNCLALAVLFMVAAGSAQNAPPPGEMPGAPGGEATNEEAFGQQQQAVRQRSPLVLPFLNGTRDKDLDFWSIPLSDLCFSGLMANGLLVTTVHHDSDLLEGFQTGKLTASKVTDRQLALDTCGGDCVVVATYTKDGDTWKLACDIYEAASPGGKAFETLETTGPSAYVGVTQFATKLAGKLGGTVAAAPRTEGGGEGGGEGGMGPDGMQGAPEGAQPPEGMQGEMGGEGMQGGQQQAPPEIEVVDLNVTAWAQGTARWPYRSARNAYRGDLDGAVKLFEQQLRDDPRFNLGYTAAALAHVAAGDVRRGVTIQQAWTEAQPDNAPDLHNYAIVLYAAGESDRAVAQYRKALDAPGGPFVVDAVSIGRIQYENGDYDAAAKAWQDGLRRFPLYRDFHIGYGVTLLKQDRAKQAAEQFQQAVAMDPGAVDGYLLLLEAYQDMRYWNKIITVARRATQEIPNRWEAWAAYADACAKYGRATEAQRAAEKTVQLGGNTPGAQQAYGEVLFNLGQFEPAATAFSRAMQLRPTWNEPKRYLAKTKLYGNDVDGAGSLLKDALLTATTNTMPATCRDYARALFFEGKYDDAMNMIKVSRDYEPENAEAIMLRSFVRGYSGDQQGCWDDFVAALKLADDDKPAAEALAVFEGATRDRVNVAYVCLGVLYERTGQKEKARSSYRKYKAVDGNGFLVDYADERLEATKSRR